VHGGHSGERVDVFALHPHALSIIPANTVEEAIFGGKQSRWHARVEDENRESKKIRQGHGPPYDCECVERWSNIIVPSQETGKCQLLKFNLTKCAEHTPLSLECELRHKIGSRWLAVTGVRA